MKKSFLFTLCISSLLFVGCSTKVVVFTPTTDAKNGEIIGNKGTRPKNLKVDSIPPRVRYIASTDSEIIAAYRAVRTAIDQKEYESLFSKNVGVFASYWYQIKSNPAFTLENSQEMLSMIQFHDTVHVYEGKVLRNSSDINTLVDEIFSGTQPCDWKIRTLTPGEMSLWWIYIGFDIEEPTFVLENSSQSKRIVAVFNESKIMMIDELSPLTPNGINMP